MKTRLLKKNEINKFKNLVHFNYKKNHILSRSSKLINFYYNYYNKNKLNIVGLFNGKELISALGFIPYKNWDITLNNDSHIAFWVKKKNSKSSLELMKFILGKVDPSFLATSGINKKTSGKIFKKFALIKNFSNYFIKNEHLICKISKNLSNNSKENFIKKKELEMVCSKSLDCIPKILSRPKKSLLYFRNKYFKNPFYNYSSMQFFEKKKLKFFFIYRIIKVKKQNSKIVRIVDFYGKIRKDYSVYFSIQKFLKKYKFEYIDFVSIGLDRELKSVGFTKKKNYHLIPDLFEPYFKKSAQRNYCILKNSYKTNIILVKSDGDGDRPNLL
jgi:hypothetical protein